MSKPEWHRMTETPKGQPPGRLWVYSRAWGFPYVRPLSPEYLEHCHDATHWHPPAITAPRAPGSNEIA